MNIRNLILASGLLLTFPLTAAELDKPSPQMPHRSPPPPFGPYMSSQQILPSVDTGASGMAEPVWNVWMPQSPDHRPYSGPGRYWASPEQEQGRGASTAGAASASSQQPKAR